MLTIVSYSFSYHYTDMHKRALPHGGGFVFDCRFLPNPGRRPEFRKPTGLDPAVVEELESAPGTKIFKQQVFDIVSNAVDNYVKRGHEYLSVGFGCTGGQHRSVYFAESLGHWIAKQNHKVIISHFRYPELLLL